MLQKMKNFRSTVLSKGGRDRSVEVIEMLEMRNLIDLGWQMVAMVVTMVPDSRQTSFMYMRASDLLNMLKRQKQQIPTHCLK